ncbi:MAG: hypothetical protein OFPII_25140 [Osedax symbiont Rs1]|nr:MAG: hypothetical protein OFPII_25140 [Osedax symbiont Rs1]
MNPYKSFSPQAYASPISGRASAADTSAMSVTQLNRQVKSMLENSFLSLRVQGELSNLAKPSSGHWYFTLKDTKAQIRCAMFKGSNRHLNFAPKEGDEVIVQAKVSLYEGRGDYQLICNSMEEAGSGRLQLAFEQLKAKLLKEGVFDASYKKSIPSLVKHLAVITSPTGAAVHDVLSVLKRRFPGLAVTIYPCQVQGAQAAASIVKALQTVQEQQVCDLVLITRGGGSLEDLWPFNEEQLARSIFACTLPVISAVGHEVDFSICDLVADYRAPTPSAAAEIISPDQDNLRIKIDQLQKSLISNINATLANNHKHHQALAARLKSPQQKLQLQQLQLSALRNRLAIPTKDTLNAAKQQLSFNRQKVMSLNPQTMINNNNTQLAHLHDQLVQFTHHQHLNYRHKLSSAAAMLHSVSPLSTLERGYSITITERQTITKYQQVEIGQIITTKLHSGEIESTITNIHPE